MRVVVYQNPDAGHEPPPAEALIRDLQRAGHEVVWLHAKEQMLDDSALEGIDLVVAAGGDGNVGRTARQMIGRGVPIAVLPLGTANNLASTLDSDKHDLNARISAWNIVPFDAATIAWEGGKHWFFEAFGVGAFADTAAMLTARDAEVRSEPNREAELARDIEALRARAAAQTPIDCQLVIDGQSSQVSLIMAEVLNIGMIGPNVPLSPAADPSDGMLDVVLVGERERQALHGFLEACERSVRPATPPVTVRAAREVAMTCATPATIHVDGWTLDVAAGSRIEIEVRPNVLRFLGGIAARPV